MEELIREQVLELRRSTQDRTLVESLEPVVAVAFGVVPLRLEGRSLHVAAIRPEDTVLIQTLGYLVGRKVVAHPYLENVVLNFLQRLYLRDKALNFNTFTQPDFLEDPTNFTRLVQEKAEVAVKPLVELPPDQIVFLDVSMRSELYKLDQPSHPAELISVRSSDLDVPYRLFGDRAIIYRHEGLPDDCRLYLQRSFCNTGLEYEHGVEATAIRTLPHNLHPTEMQIARIGKSGEVTFFIYDHTETAWPGERKSFDCCYYFLSYGSRIRRRLLLRLNDLRVIHRSRVAYQETPAAWTSHDLCRWLGLDWDDEQAPTRPLSR